MRPPPWPKAIFGLDETLAKQGETLFQTHCKACHTSEQPSLIGAWSTRVEAVGTDPKMIVDAERIVNPGILKGSIVPMLPFGRRLDDRSKALDVLGVSIVGTLINQAQIDNAQFQQNGVWRAIREDMAQVLPNQKISTRSIKRRSIKSMISLSRTSTFCSNRGRRLSPARPMKREPCMASGQRRLICTTARCRTCGNY